MKVGIIRCMQTEDYCPGTADFKAVREKTGVFADVEEDIVIIGFINCGGCPGKKAVLRARELVKRGADTLAFAFCIQKGTPIGYPCPFEKNEGIDTERYRETGQNFRLYTLKKGIVEWNKNFIFVSIVGILLLWLRIPGFR